MSALDSLSIALREHGVSVTTHPAGAISFDAGGAHFFVGDGDGGRLDVVMWHKMRRLALLCLVDDLLDEGVAR